MKRFAWIGACGLVAAVLATGASEALAGQPTKKAQPPAKPAPATPSKPDSKEKPGSDKDTGKEGVDLRPKFTKGQRLVYTMDLDSKSKTKVPALDDTDQEQSTKQELGLIFTVKDVSDDGTTLELTFSKVKVTQETGKGKDKETVEFDSSRPKAKDKDNPLAPAARELANSTLTISLDKDGQVTNVAGGSGLSSLGALGSSGGLGNLGGGGLPLPGGAGNGSSSGGGSQGFTDAIGSIFSIKKGSPYVKVGEKWSTSDEVDSGLLGKFKMVTDSQLKSHSGNMARVKVSGRIEPASQGGGAGLSMFQVKDSIYLGEYNWDTREGALKSLDMDQSVTIDGGANGGISMSASSKMKVNRVR